MPASIPPFSNRVISRLAEAEAQELDPWLCDDLRIARLIVAHAARGDAVLCSAHVLASYEVLGVHPEKVWPGILARRDALGLVYDLPPKKPAQSVKLWRSENTNAARGANSRRAEYGPPRTSTPSMATASTAAGYPNSDAPSSGKRGEYSYDDLVVVVANSGAPEHVRQLTLDALAVRGRWPKAQGPVTPLISVSVTSLQDKAVVWRSTIQRRIQRAKKDKYWSEVRSMNSWLDCPKCGAARESAKCPKCPHKGSGFDAREFRRTFTYAIDVERFKGTPPCRQVREIRARKAARRAPAPAVVAEMPARRTAEHQREAITTQITADSTKAAQRVFEFCGLADIALIAKIAIGVVAEAKFQGIDMEAAAKHVAESALRDQRNGTTLNAFYWRDLKWRTHAGQRQNSAAEQRSEHNRRAILEGFAANARDRDVPDSS